MNIYRSIGSNVGTAEAVELADRLAAWHDAMVGHERLARGGEACGDECPHSGARALWEQAVETFGERAAELSFLRSRGAAARRDARAASRTEARA